MRSTENICRQRTNLNWILLVVISLVFIPAYTQTGKVSVRGSIKNNEGKALAFATVRLVSLADSTDVKTAVTDSAGQFIITVKRKGIYSLLVSLVGYETTTVENIKLFANHILTPVQLSVNATDLLEVKVEARKSATEYREGRLVINVAGNLTMAGSNGMELLEKLPGVNLDNDGNILLNGKTGVRIMIDNVLVNLSGAQLQVFLQTKMAQQIDKIEIISNPSSQFDASGSGGVINIITRKQKSENVFYNATATISTGRYLKNNLSGSLGLKNKKWNLFLGVSFNRNKDFARPDLSRTYSDTTLTYFNQQSNQVISNNNFAINSSVDYALSAKTTIGLVIMLSASQSLNNNKSLSAFNNFNNKLVFYSDFTGLNENDVDNYGINLNFKHQFDSSGRRIHANVDCFQYSQGVNQSSTTINYDGAYLPVNGGLVLSGFLPSRYKIRSMKIDYLHPFSKFFKAEIGIKASAVDNDGAANYYILQNSQPVIDSTRSNHFLYFERIQAAYANASFQKNKWNVQLGLRAERTLMEGNQVTTNEKFTNSYLRFFPSLFVTYATSKKISVGLNMGRRTDRPEYQDLNPFKFFLDLYTYRQGNYKLKPHYTNNFEFTISKSGGFLISAFYSHITDNITRVFVRSEDTLTKSAFQTSMNLGFRKNYGMTFFYPVRFTRWWSGNLNFQVFESQYKGVIYNNEFNQRMNSYTVNATQSFKLPGNVNGELALIYRSPFLSGTFRNKSIYNLSLGLSKSFQDNRYSFRFLINDLLHSWKRRFTVKYSGMDMDYRRSNDTRYFRLVFSYTFNKLTVSHLNSSSSEEERRRLRTSDN